MSGQKGRVLRLIHSRSGLVGIAALLCLALPMEAGAQAQSAQAPGATPLPTVSVDIAKPKRRQKRAAAPVRRAAPAPQPQQQQAPENVGPTQASRSGTVGYITQRTTTEEVARMRRKAS